MTLAQVAEIPPALSERAGGYTDFGIAAMNDQWVAVTSLSL